MAETNEMEQLPYPHRKLPGFQARWHTPAIPGLWRPRHEGYLDFEANQRYTLTLAQKTKSEG